MPDLLSQEGIEKQLQALGAHDKGAALNVYDVVSSTNTLAMDGAANAVSGSVWIADQQTAGRGRRGREWYSPKAENIYLSLFWKFEPRHDLGGLSLAAGVACAEVLAGLGLANVQLKWPNDVLVAGRKLGGLLTELSQLQREDMGVVVGVGLNIDMGDGAAESIDQDWTDFKREVGEAPSRNLIAAKLIVGLRDAMSRFERNGLVPFLPSWHAFDYLAGAEINVLQGGQTDAALALGIAEDGALRVSLGGEERLLYGGEVSVRKSR